MNTYNFCSLCGKFDKICSSHIIPKFVSDWFKMRSSTGYVRHGEKVNLRQQDSKKLKLFCLSCEQLLSQYEKQFSEKIFLPFHKHDFKAVKYNKWLYDFIISLSYRVLLLHKDEWTKECKMAYNYFSQ